MKRLLATSLMCLGIALSANAQGELQFGQVRLIEVTGNAPSNTTTVFTESIVVETGKVLKIEWAGVSRKISGSDVWNYNSDDHLNLDGYRLTFPTTHRALPMWLPAGTYELQLQMQLGGTTAEGKGKVSAIEFNVEQ